MFETELQFFIENQEKLVAEHEGKVLAIRGREVVGVYNDALEAYLDCEERFESGSYMLQPCEPGRGAFTVTIAA